MHGSILLGGDKMAISDWPEDERPRERLLAHGAASLSDAELLAIFLRVGVKGKSAVDLGRDLISRFRGLNRMFSASQAEFSALPGMGPAKYAQLQAVLEMARRALSEEMRQGMAFASPGAVRDYLRLHLAGLEHEVFFALWLDAQNRLIAAEELFRGTLGRLASIRGRSSSGRCGTTLRQWCWHTITPPGWPNRHAPMNC